MLSPSAGKEVSCPMENFMLPLGVDIFEELRTKGYYYIDKTRFIEELLSEQFKVNLITRPRRFGKTLTMSMLADFFDIRKDSRAVFDGLAIMENKELCAGWMNQYPVLFVTLKDVEDLTFADAYAQLEFVISSLCIEHSYLLESDRTDERDKHFFAELKAGNAARATVKNSLLILTRMMKAHFGKPVILLIDEYDVPLAKAYEHGHYTQMLNSIRGILSTALKTNGNLQFAVVTGCLRIAKESIFTGTNHFVSNSIAGRRYQGTFGFTQEDVDKLLVDMELKEYTPLMKHWYDGYRIGSEEIYCPWDVLNYVSDLRQDKSAQPGSYWKDTSHNDIIRSFIGQTGFNVTDRLETLLAGGYVKVKLCDDLTYDLVHGSEENFWSILYLTGYLTGMKPEELSGREELEPGEACLKIPNEEVKTIFSETVVEWFRDNMRDTNRQPLMAALWEGEEEKASAMLSELLFHTISYHNYKEDFYQAFLTGIFVGLGYATENDREHGLGRPDLVVKDKENRRAMIIETKHAKSGSALDRECMAAVDQIAVQKYAREYLEGYKTLVCYWVAFYKKTCRIRRVDIGEIM